jgi:hypothetical protein
MGKTAAQKLGIKPGNRVYPINAPAEYAELLGELPAGASLADAGPADVVHLFAHDLADLDRHAKAAIDALAPGGLFWISYPKGGRTDIRRDDLMLALVPLGWRGVSLVAVDETWSAARFRPLAEIGR